MAMTIFYKLHDKLYANLTNKCPCNCTFCLRQGGESVGSADSLWLEHEPAMDEIKAAFDKTDLTGMVEIVFCGYGEPMERAEDVIETARYIRSKCPLPLRINTNGLVKLMFPDFDMLNLAAVDTVSISLNTDSKEEYLQLTRPSFGDCSYESMLDFAREAKKYTNVCLTVVDVLEPERIENCRRIAADIGVKFLVRSFVLDNASHD